jgi:hypothetical protein
VVSHSDHESDREKDPYKEFSREFSRMSASPENCVIRLDPRPEFLFAALLKEFGD